MVRKFITFLGTSEYKTCQYEINEKLSHGTPFIQDALIDLLYKQEIHIDEFHVLLTPEARKKNWEPEGKLKELLQKYQQENNLKIIEHDISSEQNLEMIWKMFDTFIAIMNKDDRVIFDITHSFRYQPMLALSAIHFARITKNVQVDGIYYGVYYENVANKKFPIIDLTAFIDLQDWITNVYIFSKTGRADSLTEWIREKEKFIRREEKASTEDLKAVKKLADHWKTFSATLQTNRSFEIKKNTENVLESINKVKKVELRPNFLPLNELLANVENEVKSMADSDLVISNLSAIEWCINHGLYQQAYTLANELSITVVCIKLNYELENIDLRKKASDILMATVHAFQNRGKKSLHEIYPKIVDQNSITNNVERKFVQHLLNFPELLSIIHQINFNRNDINHAGWRKEPLSGLVFEKHLNEKFVEFKNQLLKFYKEKFEF
ncbi:MAG: TIGR02221 family CRISPR-associated protein [Caldibacillus debilis]|uniref:TIGR02221 family CRISPR-associated protein n=1 Tax=Caldibacillus debilis TaxID=301148 RepID=UPI000E3B3281|nr:TIGR02221 family CRISPR-associated protein [Caldibacillus debilis]REJ16217.1 MAG: TIGR02221 family CRISPR-associated protein [Caldibacillus debilis]